MRCSLSSLLSRDQEGDRGDQSGVRVNGCRNEGLTPNEAILSDPRLRVTIRKRAPSVLPGQTTGLPLTSTTSSSERASYPSPLFLFFPNQTFLFIINHPSGARSVLPPPPTFPPSSPTPPLQVFFARFKYAQQHKVDNITTMKFTSALSTLLVLLPAVTNAIAIPAPVDATEVQRRDDVVVSINSPSNPTDG